MRKSLLLALWLGCATTAAAQQPIATTYRATECKVNDLVHTKLDLRFDYARRYAYGKEWLTLKPHATAAVGPLFEGLAPAVRQSLDGQAFAARLADARRLGVGQLAPDFTQNDPRGRPVSLRDFRGQYVLLDFWASWCKPCRAENPALVAAYQQFKSRHFAVLSVSLDQDKGKWENAIAADGLNWTHVSDLKPEQNEVARRYGIAGVPQNLLIGPDGRILALNLHGTALRQKLAAVLPAAAP